MSRQFYVYLLPADVESLVETLKDRVGISLIQPWSPHARTTPLRSPIVNETLKLGPGATRVDCYIVQPEAAKVRLYFLPGRARWHVDIESEAIEFAGCEFDGAVLLRGRLYFQTDFVAGDTIAPKSKEFLQWADRVFRVAKKSMRRSKTLDAYVGDAAERWAKEGGRLAWTATPKQGPIYVALESR